MILKTLSRKSNTGQLVKYVLRYIFADKTNEGTTQKPVDFSSAFLIRHNVRSKTLKGMIQEIEENEKFRWHRRKNNVKLFHHVISFSPKDKEAITDAMLSDIAEKFIDMRNPNCMYVGAKHEEGVDHIHLHIIQSPIEISGRSASISKRRFLELRKSLQAYQAVKYPQLINSLPNLQAEYNLTKEALLKRIKATRQTTKAFLMETLEGIYADATSRQEYLLKLDAEGCKPYYRNNKLQGIQYDGLKYRLSKIGMTEELLDGLDKKETMHKALSQFERLRSGTQVQEQSVLFQETSQAKTDALAGLSNIRTRSHEVETDMQKDVEMEFPKLPFAASSLKQLRPVSFGRSD